MARLKLSKVNVKVILTIIFVSKWRNATTWKPLLLETCQFRLDMEMERNDIDRSLVETVGSTVDWVYTLALLPL